MSGTGFLLVVLGLWAVQEFAAAEAHIGTKDPQPLKVVTTMFPLYDFATRISGSAAEVKTLLQPGVDPHGYSPTPRDMVMIGKSDLFIYLGDGIESWAAKLSRLNEDKPIVGFSMQEALGTSTNEHGHEASDRHFWLDPVMAKKMVDALVKEFSRVRPAQAGKFKVNGNRLSRDLMDLHRDIETALISCSSSVLVHGGHYTFGSFCRRYGLEYLPVMESRSPNAQLSPKRLAEFISKVESLNINVVYYEAMHPPRIARVIAEAVDAELMALHGLHNLSRSEAKQGLTYIDLMRRNLDHLKRGLQCP